MLDNTRLTSELTHIHRILSAVAATPRGRGLLDELRRTVGGSTAALLRQALFADCLRVTCSAVAADGRVHDEEIEATYEPLFSMARHYAAVLPERYGDFSAIEPEAAHRFLKCYTDDRGPFGRGSAQHWPGLTLCRRAAELGEAQALERYEAMMSWLITEACHIGGVAEGAPRWRGRVDELVDLRRELARERPREPRDPQGHARPVGPGHRPGPDARRLGGAAESPPGHRRRPVARIVEPLTIGWGRGVKVTASSATVAGTVAEPSTS